MHISKEVSISVAARAYARGEWIAFGTDELIGEMTQSLVPISVRRARKHLIELRQVFVGPKTFLVEMDEEAE